MDSERATQAFSALGQETRLEVFRLLLRAGAQGMLAGELATALAMRQNTMSINLSVLSEAGLIRPERQGRSVRYSADPAGLQALLRFLLEDCCGGDPGSCDPALSPIISAIGKAPLMSEKPYNVLFLCTGNSARSIMAEAIMSRAAPGKFKAFSAGSHPAGAVNPNAITLLQKLNFDTSQLRSKSWDEFAASDAPEMDFVFTVCDDAAAEVCPVWPGQPMTAHWGVPDPAKATGSPAEIALAFADAFRMLDRRIGVFCALPISGLDTLTLKKRVSDIGRS